MSQCRSERKHGRSRKPARKRHYKRRRADIESCGNGEWAWSSDEGEFWGERPSVMVPAWEKGEDREAGLGKEDEAWSRRMAIATVLRANATDTDGNCLGCNKPHFDFKDFNEFLYPKDSTQQVVKARAPLGSLWYHRPKESRRRFGPRDCHFTTSSVWDDDTGYSQETIDEFETQSCPSSEGERADKLPPHDKYGPCAIGKCRHPYGWSSDSDEEGNGKRKEEDKEKDAAVNEFFYMLSHNPAEIFDDKATEVNGDAENEQNRISSPKLELFKRELNGASPGMARVRGKQEPFSIEDNSPEPPSAPHGKNAEVCKDSCIAKPREFNSEIDLTPEQRYHVKIGEGLEFCGSLTGMIKNSNNYNLDRSPDNACESQEGSDMLQTEDVTPQRYGARILRKYGYNYEYYESTTAVQQALKENTQKPNREELGYQVGNGEKRQLSMKVEEELHTSVKQELPQDSSGVQGAKEEIKKVKAVESRKPTQENLLFETDDGESRHSYSGKRVIIAEFDIFVSSAHKRRKRAFQEAIQASGLFPRSSVPILSRDNFDLSDFEAVEALFEKNCAQKYTQEDQKKFLETLDSRFAELKPAPNIEICNAVEKASHHVPVLVCHRGTKRRFSNELESLNAFMSFLRGRCISIKPQDRAPYRESWKHLLQIEGVPGPQALFVLSVHDERKPSSGLTAGRLLGARTLSVVDSDGSKMKTEVTKVSLETYAGIEATVKDFEFHNTVNLRGLTATPIRRRRFRRLLALYVPDGLYYAAREIAHSKEKEKEQSYVRFCYLGNCEWVKAENTSPLSEQGYLALYNNEFPGVAHPDDVSLFMR